MSSKPIQSSAQPSTMVTPQISTATTHSSGSVSLQSSVQPSTMVTPQISTATTHSSGSVSLQSSVQPSAIVTPQVSVVSSPSNVVSNVGSTASASNANILPTVTSKEQINGTR